MNFRNKLFVLTTIIFLFDLFLFWGGVVGQTWETRRRIRRWEKRQTHAWKVKVACDDQLCQTLYLFQAFRKTYLPFLRSKLYELYIFFSLKELTTLNLSYIDIKMLAWIVFKKKKKSKDASMNACRFVNFHARTLYILMVESKRWLQPYHI